MASRPTASDPYDYPVYRCPSCGGRAVSVHSSDPDIILRCDDCEQRYYPDEHHEVEARRILRSAGDPFHGVWEVWDNEERQGAPLRIDLGDSRPASVVYPEEFSDEAVRQRRFKENTVLLGCLTFLVATVVMMVLAAFRCA